MSLIIKTNDSRATRLLDVAGIKYTLTKKAPAKPVTLSGSDNAWTIKGVHYQGQVIPITLSRELLPAMNLGQMVKHAKKAMEKGEPHSANAQVFYAVAKRAMEQDNREVQKFMRETIFNQYPNLLSVVRYAPKGKLDEIVHNPRLLNRYSAKVDFVAPDEFIRGSKRREDYEALVGADNPDEVADVLGWVTGRKAYLWRVNRRPPSVDERVVGLSANSDRFDLDCSRGPQNAVVSFRVILPQKILKRKS